MKRSALTAVTGAATLVAGLAATLASAPAATAGPVARILHTAHVCATPVKGHASCDAQVVVDSTGKPATAAAPSGYGPADIRSAYALSATAGKGKTIAVIDAYNDPTAEADLTAYRKHYALPVCTTANGCFRKVSQKGTATLPKSDAGWATETSLDLDMVSASCASCKILLVEATTDSMPNLALAVNYAATQKVSAISNSYSSNDTAQNAAYNHPGIAITASTGDSGYGSGAPATFNTVIAVGGTTLKKSTNTRHWTETAWSGAGSSCSTLNTKPSWQTTATQCSGRAVADVSAVADPNTGVAVYDTTKFDGVAGWQVYGGTSAAAPIIAGVYTMSGNTAGYPASYTWAHSTGLNDVTSGSNGSASKSVWSKAQKGWDGPTGLGTPKGTASF